MGSVVGLGVPVRRAVRVDMAGHVRVHAGDMSAGVRSWSRSSSRVRRLAVREVRARFAADRVRFGLGAGAVGLSVVQRPGARVQQTKLARNALPTVGLTLQSAGGCRVLCDDGVTRVLHTCPDAGACALVCVLGHGRGEWRRVRAARDWRTFCLWSDPVGFAVLLRAELEAARDRFGVFSARLNVNADIPWYLVPELVTVRGMRGYDYSKDPGVLDGGGWETRQYRRVYSWSEKSDPVAVRRFLSRGGTVAMVTDRARGAAVVDRVRIGGRWFPVVDGDQSDDRWSDPAGVVVDLYAKGRAVRATGVRSRLVVPVYSHGADIVDRLAVAR